MRRYYLTLSRISLGVIVLQAIFLIYSAFHTEELNVQIERVIEQQLHQSSAANQVERAVKENLYAQATTFQAANRANHWLLKAILIFGFLHLMVMYSLYIHFLRMGYSWTKLALHANNLAVFLVTPVLLVFWVPAYVIGTRIYKHRCVATGFVES